MALLPIADWSSDVDAIHLNKIHLPLIQNFVVTDTPL